jgi:hypothetical protein
MRKLVIAGLLAITAGLAGCTTATPYQPDLRGSQVSGGFSETRVTNDRFRVQFRGNTLTSRDTVERYLLYRAAELTLAQGYDWFEIDDRRTDRTERTYVDSMGPRMGWGGGWGYGMWQPSWRYYGAGFGWRSWNPYFGDPFFADRMDIRTVQQFEAGAEIILHRGPTPEGSARAFDARQVKQNLEPTIIRPQPR